MTETTRYTIHSVPLSCRIVQQLELILSRCTISACSILCAVPQYRILIGWPSDCFSGAQPLLKSWGGPRFRSLHRGACPRARPQTGLQVGVGCPLPLWWSGGITPEIFFENSDAKSCILVTTSLQNYWLLHILVGSLGCVYPIKQLACQWLSQFQNFNFAAMVAPLVVRTKKQSSRNCEIMLWNFFLFENYGQEVGGLIHCWSPQPKRLVTLFDL